MRQDQVRYSRATVESLLPSVWDEDWILHPPKGQQLDVKIKRQPAEALNDWQLAVCDVGLAFKRAGLSGLEKDVLKRRVHWGWNVGWVAGALQITPDDVELAELRAVGKITDWLNGRR